MAKNTEECCILIYSTWFRQISSHHHLADLCCNELFLAKNFIKLFGNNDDMLKELRVYFDFRIFFMQILQK
jgi:hypothetical protein